VRVLAVAQVNAVRHAGALVIADQAPVSSIDVTDAARACVGALTTVGPAALVLACVVLAIAGTTAVGRTSLALGLRGLTGRRPSVPRQALAGLAIPLIAVTAATAGLAFERELREGPNRVLYRLIGDARGDPQWLMQADTRHFMNDSRLPASVVTAAATSRRATIFWSQLTDITPRGRRSITALVVSSLGPAGPVPVSVDGPTARCRISGGRCALEPDQAVTDADVAEIGERILLRGRPVTIVAHTAIPASLLNRAVVFVNPGAFDRAGGPRESPFAIVAAGAGGRTALQAIQRAYRAPGELEIRDTASIASANRRFWAGNGTPIILILIVLVIVFGGVAYYTSRKAASEHAHVALATLLSLGVPPRVLASAELVRGTVSALVAACVGGALAAAIVRLANSQILGFHATVNVAMVAASAGLMVLACCAALVGSWIRLRRTSLAEAMAG